MTDSDSIQYIQFACKQCGKTFTRVPYERIVLCGIAECSACKTRFTLDKEEIHAALVDAQQSNAASAPTEHDTPMPDSLSSEEPQEMDAEDGLDFDEHIEDEEPDSAGTEETMEMDAEDGLDFDEHIEDEEPDSAGTEETMEMDAEDGLDFDEHIEDEEPGSTDTEETMEVAAEDGLDFDEKIDSEEPGSLDGEEPLEMEADEGLDFGEQIDSEEPDSLSSEEPLEIEAEKGLDFDEQIDDEDSGNLSDEEPQESITGESIADAIVSPPEEIPETQTPATAHASLAPEKEDKIEFARRLSRLVPEGWVNPIQDSAVETPEDATAGDFSTPDVCELEGHHQFLVFALDTAEFAVPVENTIEIGEVPDLTRLPHVPDWLLGISNLRGDIVSVIDIKNFLGLGAFDAESLDRIIMLRSRNDELHTAVIVNRIAGIHYVAEQDIVAAETEPHDAEPYICGVFEIDGRPIAVLDIENFLLSEDMQQFRTL